MRRLSLDIRACSKPFYGCYSDLLSLLSSAKRKGRESRGAEGPLHLETSVNDLKFANMDLEPYHQGAILPPPPECAGLKRGIDLMRCPNLPPSPAHACSISALRSTAPSSLKGTFLAFTMRASEGGPRWQFGSGVRLLIFCVRWGRAAVAFVWVGNGEPNLVLHWIGSLCLREEGNGPMFSVDAAMKMSQIHNIVPTSRHFKASRKASPHFNSRPI